MSGRKSKSLGTSFEYRIANWFEAKDGWNGKRNPLSGASTQIEEAVGKHDVRAWNDDQTLFLQIEAKKKSAAKKPNKLIIQKEWIDKINFEKDELLVFATNRSPLYVFLPYTRFCKVLGRAVKFELTKDDIYKGEKQLTFDRAKVDDTEDNRYFLAWRNSEYVILLLEDFITLRETADISDDLTPEEEIKRIGSLEKAEAFEKANLSTLTYKQKRLLYSKFEQLESGTLINPLAHADQQFWLDDSFILACPHCKVNITKKDLKKLKGLRPEVVALLLNGEKQT